MCECDFRFSGVFGVHRGRGEGVELKYFDLYIYGGRVCGISSIHCILYRLPKSVPRVVLESIDRSKTFHIKESMGMDLPANFDVPSDAAKAGFNLEGACGVCSIGRKQNGWGRRGVG